MVRFFQTYDQAEGIPSFEKFADTIGADAQDIDAWSKQSKHFRRAVARCTRILRDRLTDAALLRRYDPSFCKYVLDSMNDVGDSDGDGRAAPFKVEIIVV